jgi:multidrug efflux pump subunit AcrB
VEETARLCDQIEAVLRQEIPKGQLQTVLDNIGLPNSGINQSYSSNGTIGSSDAEILIALDPEHHPPTAGLTRHLREVLPQRFPGVEFFFQPADIVTQILNFGLPAPIDVQIVGTDMQSRLPTKCGTFPAPPMSTSNSCSRCPRCTWISTVPAPRRSG